MNTLNNIVERLGAGLGALADRIPAVLAEPRAYPREAMLLAAIVALLLVLAILAAVVVFDFVKLRDRRRKLGVRNRQRWHPAIIGVAVLALVMFAGSLAPNLLAVSRQCDSCHAIEPAVTAWRADSHATVSCYGCHSQGGLSGSLQASVQGAFRLVGGTSSARVYDSRCIGCHEYVEGEVVGTDVLMRHSDVIEAGFSCLDCHPVAGHDSGEYEYEHIDRSLMSLCLTCHDGVTASSDCQLCHESRPSDSSDATPIANTPAPVTCNGCHSEQTTANCIDCHGLELPHPQEFFAQHAGASWNDPDLCMSCHENARYERGCGCHSDVNIHGTYTEWFPRHGPQALEVWPGGCNCHETDFCGLCHLTSPF